jgi:hypothetical protein
MDILGPTGFIGRPPSAGRLTAVGTKPTRGGQGRMTMPWVMPMDVPQAARHRDSHAGALNHSLELVGSRASQRLTPGSAGLRTGCGQFPLQVRRIDLRSSCHRRPTATMSGLTRADGAVLLRQGRWANAEAKGTQAASGGDDIPPELQGHGTRHESRRARRTAHVLRVRQGIHESICSRPISHRGGREWLGLLAHRPSACTSA